MVVYATQCCMMMKAIASVKYSWGTVYYWKSSKWCMPRGSIAKMNQIVIWSDFRRGQSSA